MITIFWVDDIGYDGRRALHMGNRNRLHCLYQEENYNFRGAGFGVLTVMSVAFWGVTARSPERG